MTGTLHHRPTGGGRAAHEQRNAHDAVTADHGDFGGRPVFSHPQQGHDGGDREVVVAEPAARFTHHLTQGHVCPFQVRLPAVPHLRWQRRHQPVAQPVELYHHEGPFIRTAMYVRQTTEYVRYRTHVKGVPLICDAHPHQRHTEAWPHPQTPHPTLRLRSTPSRASSAWAPRPAAWPAWSCFSPACRPTATSPTSWCSTWTRHAKPCCAACCSV